MSRATWLNYSNAKHLDLERVCGCVELDVDEDGVGWVAQQNCPACVGRGVRRRDLVLLPTTAPALQAWAARGALSLAEYEEVLRYRRRVEELEALRLEDEEDDSAEFRRLLRTQGRRGSWAA